MLEVAYSPDGRTILTGCSDGTAQLWDASTFQPTGRLLKHLGSVAAVAFSPDGLTLLTGGEDANARFWEAKTGRPVGDPLPQPTEVTALAFRPDGKIVLVAAGTRARFWDVSTRVARGAVMSHHGKITSVTFRPDGRVVLTGGEDNTVRLWEVGTGRPLGDPIDHPATVRAVAFSPDGQTIVTGCNDRKVRLWNAATGEPIGPPLEHQGRVSAVAISADGRTVLSGSFDQTVRLWDVPVPMKDDVKQIELWVQVLTGMKLDTRLNPSGAVQLLDDATWHKNRVLLERSGDRPCAQERAGNNEIKTPMTRDPEYAFDVFISYRKTEPDSTWVQDNLVPALERAGLRVFLDVKDFVPGRNLIEEISRAGRESRHALCIVSPDYLVGERLVHFESLQSRHRDPDGKDSVLVPFILRKTELPDWLAQLVQVNWTVAAHTRREWNKLLAVLNAKNRDVEPPPALPSARAPEMQGAAECVSEAGGDMAPPQPADPGGPILALALILFGIEVALILIGAKNLVRLDLARRLANRAGQCLAARRPGCRRDAARRPLADPCLDQPPVVYQRAVCPGESLPSGNGGHLDGTDHFLRDDRRGRRYCASSSNSPESLGHRIRAAGCRCWALASS